MKFVFKYCVLLTLAVGCFKAGNAQNKPRPNSKSYKILAKQEAVNMEKLLSLTKQQSSKVEALILSYWEKRNGLSPDLQKGDRQNQIKQMDQWYEEQLREILNPDQYKNYQEILNKRKEEIRKKNDDFNKRIVNKKS